MTCVQVKAPSRSNQSTKDQASAPQLLPGPNDRDQHSPDHEPKPEPSQSKTMQSQHHSYQLHRPSHFYVKNQTNRWEQRNNTTSIKGNSIPFAYNRKNTRFWSRQDRHGSDTTVLRPTCI